jgi:hypothetical protein
MNVQKLINKTTTKLFKMNNISKVGVFEYKFGDPRGKNPKSEQKKKEKDVKSQKEKKEKESKTEEPKGGKKK